MSAVRGMPQPADARMSAEPSHTETFQAIGRAYFSGDFDAAWALIDPEIEWIEPRGVPGSSTYHGHEGVRESITKFVGTWDDYRVEHHDLAEAGDHLFVRARITGKGRSSGVPSEMDEFQVWTFRNGKAVRLEMFLDEDEARRAAGVELAKGEAGR